MNNNHQTTDRLTQWDVMLLFVLKAPDQRKAIAALEILFGACYTKQIINYKKKFNTFQDWHNHLVAALDNAQEKIDAERKR